MVPDNNCHLSATTTKDSKEQGKPASTAAYGIDAKKLNADRKIAFASARRSPAASA
jgi:hypothetical protein